jgi:Second Messenger Oligonucleotide or Dinucleotide Synthetase domain
MSFNPPSSPFLFPLANPLGSLFGLSSAPTPVANWQYVRRRFAKFLGNLEPTADQHADGTTKHGGVRAALNRAYYGHSSETANSLLIGSWGKNTRVRPSRDVDLIFLLPASMHGQYEQRSGNRQSALLQEVRNVLARTYTQTTIRGDGQVVVIPFNSIPVEVALGFRCADANIIVCDTNSGGTYKISSAEAEANELAVSDARWSGNTRALIRMLKSWQRENNVQLKSFQIERIAIFFLNQWQYSHHDLFWYDWMIRDFFGFLVQQPNKWFVMPGNNEVIYLGDEWLFQAQRAQKHALAACENEHDNYEATAGLDWQKIFGTTVPVLVS